MRTLNIALAVATSMAAVAVAQTANAYPSGNPAAVSAEQAAVGQIEHLQNVRHVGGFPVYAFGPIPSGFGDELRTGRPYYAGSVYARRTHYGYGYGYGYRDQRHARPVYRGRR